MAIRKSQAFAAYRTEVISQLQANINEELIPHFNAEVNDIRVKHEEMSKESAALADHNKRSRIMDLKIRQQQFLADMNKELQDRLAARVKDYGGKVEERTITDGSGKEKPVLEAVFDDGSTARLPKSLWIDYNSFDRV